MNCKLFLFTSLVIITVFNNAMGTLTAERFPQTANDITFLQNIDSDGYKIYKDAIIYQPITITAPTSSTPSEIQGTVSPNAAATPDYAPGQQTEQNDNTAVAQPNNQYSSNNNAGDASGQPNQPAIVQPNVANNSPHVQPALQNNTQPPATANNATPPTSGNSPARGTCYSRDTTGNRGFNHYLPPQNKTGRIYWWIGDSRFKGMAIDTIIGDAPNEGVIAQGGAGHTWFKGTAIPMLEKCLRDNDVVILAMGANDIGCQKSSANSVAQTYITTYGNLINAHPGVTFRILSVNPVYEPNARQHNYCLTNSLIEAFNNVIKQSTLNRYYIDTYTPLKPMVTARTSGDGIHYAGGRKSNKIESLIYNKVMESVSGN